MTFYNTTNEKGLELKKAKEKAISQDKQILAMFDTNVPGISSNKLSASLIFKQMNCPITSIRRALNTLENKGSIKRLDVKINGLYGRKEYMYKKI